MSAEAEREELGAIAGRIRNWGRWGVGDERGTLNHVTDSHIVQAGSLIRQGKVFALGLPMRHSQGACTRDGGRFNALHTMTMTGDIESGADLGGGADYSDDMLVMPTQCTTQWDAFCHVYYDNTMYNGFPSSTVTSQGAARNGIDKVHDSFVGRGVLLDLARVHGVECLEAPYSITGEDLETAADSEGVEVREGDFLLLRTGRMAAVRRGDWSGFAENRPEAGLHYQAAEWLADHAVAAVAADNTAVEARPSTMEHIHIPFHMLALTDMGLPLGELWYLEELADHCASQQVYEFFLAAQALQIVGGTGSPLNPLAIT